MSPLRPDESPAIYSQEREAGNASPTAAGARERRDRIVEGLRARIRRIEGDAILSADGSPPAGGWTLGVEGIDRLLGPEGLDAAGVHEIGGAILAGMSAAAALATRRVFGLMLAARRLAALERPGPLLWCLSRDTAGESGLPSSRGVAALGLDPDRLLLVGPCRSRDVPWVLEEALKAGCLSLVAGEVAELAATAARRLSLAAAQGRTPCLLLPPAGRSGVAAVATRWGVLPRPGGDDDLDPAAPGARGFALKLERCRVRPLVSGPVDFAVEWCDATRRFRLAATVSDRAAPSHAARSSGPEEVRSWRRRAG